MKVNIKNVNLHKWHMIQRKDTYWIFGTVKRAKNSQNRAREREKKTKKQNKVHFTLGAKFLSVCKEEAFIPLNMSRSFFCSLHLCRQQKKVPVCRHENCLQLWWLAGHYMCSSSSNQPWYTCLSHTDGIQTAAPIDTTGFTVMFSDRLLFNHSVFSLCKRWAETEQRFNSERPCLRWQKRRNEHNKLRWRTAV